MSEEKFEKIPDPFLKGYSAGLDDGHKSERARILAMCEELSDELDENHRTCWSGEVTSFVERLKQKLSE